MSRAPGMLSLCSCTMFFGRLLLLPLLGGFLLWAAEPAADELREQAVSAWREARKDPAKKEEAVALISKAIAASPKDSGCFTCGRRCA